MEEFLVGSTKTDSPGNALQQVNVIKSNSPVNGQQVNVIKPYTPELQLQLQMMDLNPNINIVTSPSWNDEICCKKDTEICCKKDTSPGIFLVQSR